MTLLHQAAQKAVLTDKQIQDAVFVVLRRWNTDRAWDRYTRESGPYDVTSLRPEVLEIIRAVLAIVPPALQHQEVPREPVAKDVRVSDFIAGAAWHMANPDDSLDALQEAAEWWATEHASPSTTRQQEVGSFDEWVAREWPNATDGERDVAWSAWHAAAPSTPEKAGGVSDGVDALGQGQR